MVAPRLPKSREPEPLLIPPKALPPEPPEGRLTEGEGLGAGRDALGDGLGRLALGEAAGRLAEGVPVEGLVPALPVEGRVPAVPVAGRAPTLPVEGPALPEPQPRASALRVAALAEPLLFSRLWSGCHFCCPPVAEVRALLALLFRLMLALLLTLTFTLPL